MLNSLQIEMLIKYMDLLLEWNKKINLISRKDTDHFILHHLIHSLAFLKISSIKQGSEVGDIGSGGGLPAIPLSIIFEGSSFTLIESVGKKVMVMNDIISQLGIGNVCTYHGRAENLKKKFDIITGRAVAAFDSFRELSAPLLKKGGKIYYWTGNTGISFNDARIHHLNNFFDERFFEEKVIIEYTNN